ncbi:MAG: hypothetical protein ACXVDT_15400 [Bacteroidia bacterium]
MRKISLVAITAAIVITSCKSNEPDYDAAGAFESVETIVSTEASGTIKEFKIEEGQTLQPGQYVGYVDSTQLYLRKQQLLAQVASTTSQMPNIAVQTAALQSQLEDAEKNQARMNTLIKQDAATQQQVDNANTQVDMIKNRSKRKNHHSELLLPHLEKMSLRFSDRSIR